MIVSWNWLKDYVPMQCSVSALTDRLMMAGFNLEGVEEKDGDFAIDLEITSNRPDCLGHLGVAREIAVLFGWELKLPDAAPHETGPNVAGRLAVEIAGDAPWCPQYRARLIENVKIGPSPAWMQRRLTAVGVRPIGNVVDVTNYVMLECGQPLHAFDFAKVADGKIVVRNALANEKLTAINHKEYELAASDGVIADPKKALALAGVMGGASTEIGSHTTAVLLESAEFAPLAIRRTSRRLDLSSDSSYRFERRIDPVGVAWACDRAAKLIAETAGGAVASGVAVAGSSGTAPRPIRLRWTRPTRILGIDISAPEAKTTLVKLGCEPVAEDSESGTFRPPTFRRDLTREIDLVEEVGRIHGYADVPENRAVPLVAAPRRRAERVAEAVRGMLGGFGYCEAVTLTAMESSLATAVRVWSAAAPIATDHSKFRQTNALRQSLLPSLLGTLAFNEARGNRGVGLYEIAHVFLPNADGLPTEPPMVGMAWLVDGADKNADAWRQVRGHVEALFGKLRASATLQPTEIAGLASAGCAEWRANDRRVGAIGCPGRALLERTELRGSAVLAEFDLGWLTEAAELVVQVQPIPDRPAVERDLAVVFDEAVRWTDVEAVARAQAGEALEALEFVDLYRGKQVPDGKKSLAFRLTYRAPDRTLTKDEVDERQQRIVAALAEKLGGSLRA
jgi:phenylalanyl-tRNA synthetase beta chain